MTKYTLLAVALAISVAGSTGCCGWHYGWGNCGCADGYCGYGGCEAGCGSHCGSACGGNDCCDSDCGCCGFECGLLRSCWNGCKRLFWCPHPIGAYDCCHGGCGELFICDWLSYPPCKDQCDCCGNYMGDHDPRPCYQMSPRFGSVPLHHPDGEVIEGGEQIEAVPPPAPAKPNPNVQQPRSGQRRTRTTETAGAHRTDYWTDPEYRTRN